MTTGIVLAGGKSLRFGAEKALVKVNSEKLVELVIKALKPITDEIIVVTNSEQYNNYLSLHLDSNIVTDIIPGKAALGGIYTGLMNSQYTYSIVVACDMPFLNNILLEHMVNEAMGFDVVVPKMGNFIEPLHAVYSKNCIDALEKLIYENNLSIYQFIYAVSTKYIYEKEIRRFDPNLTSFYNINTRDDLRKVKEILRLKRN